MSLEPGIAQSSITGLFGRCATLITDVTSIIKHAFNDNAPQADSTEQTDIAKYSAFLDSLAFITTEEIANRPETEAKLRKEFRSFLIDCNMPLAAKNFDALLEEKSGDKARRNDGTVGWYHEFIPITMMLHLAVLGKENGGFDIKDMDEHGGMETLLITHLRHDSVEDHISAAAMTAEQEKYRDEIKAENPAYDLDKENTVIRHSLNDIDLMSQRRLFNEDGRKVIVNGKHEKEDVKVYTARMIYADSPFPFMLKLADIIQNSSTFLGARKFDDPAKRLEKCNAYEDMYGPRYGFTDLAKEKWPEFKEAIQTLDDMMGFILYRHFRYLESVDLANPKKIPFDSIPATSRFNKGAMAIPLPIGISPIATSLVRMAHAVDPEDAEKHARYLPFMGKVIKPSFNLFEGKIQYPYDNTPPLISNRLPTPVVS